MAESVRPDSDVLTNVDRPAPPDQFETAGRQVWLNERPVAEPNVPSSNVAGSCQPHEGAEVEHEGEDAVVTEAGGAAGDVKDSNVDPDVKQSGLKGRLQYLKVNTKLLLPFFPHEDRQEWLVRSIPSGA